MGGGAANKTDEPFEITIDGKIVDVTEFAKRHPGGNILKFYAGKDATVAFNEFHSRSPHARKWLNALPSRPSSDDLPQVEKDFIAFRSQLEAEGYFRPSPVHIAYRFLEILAIHFIGLKLLFAHWWWTAALVLGVGAGRCGWLMHEAGHYSLTGVPKLDRLLQAILYCVGDGMSSSYWRNQHNKHHAAPQHLKHDVDLQTLPLIAFHKKVAAKGSRLWLRWQAYLFSPVITFLVAFGWQFFLHPRFCLRAKKYDELAFFALRYALIGYFIVPDLGLGTTVAMYLLASAFGGAYIFTTFSVSHTHKPAVEADSHRDWVAYAADHTTNITPHWFTTWFMGLLNFQIEHHLLPSMPQHRFPEIAPRVRAFIEAHGMTYDCRGFFETLAVTFKNLDHVGQHAGTAAKE
eukprot:a201_582.p1 GENE.a201_582~~a201_582.p1  ORF type:complete len:418 (+),score=145.36 a201_582:45-1256(+)